MIKYKKILFIFISLILFVTIYMYYPIHLPKENELESGSKKNTILLSKDFNVADGIEEMVLQSDVIVVGHYQKLLKSWNMSGSSEPSEFTEGHLYQFKVEDTLKGNSESIIKINHRYSETVPIEVTSGDEIISDEGILIKDASKKQVYTVTNKDPLYIKPELNQKYIAFLQKGNTGNYFGSLEPYLIKFNEEDIAILQSNLTDLQKENLSFNKNLGGQNITVTNDIHQQVIDNISGDKFDSIKEKIIEISQN
ncbi:hypothetical protein J2W90_002704 [Bacillus pumilus]|uniref:cardiolipin synthase n=3 Tax=Bacillus TaxID=1386 RepID=UPI00285FDFF5|nr:cardiolipin synthase [Bacillus pumilus]MDR6748550.1 hypothetical protein [Bacillus pumilus]